MLDPAQEHGQEQEPFVTEVFDAPAEPPPPEVPVPSGAPWDFLDLIFTAMVVFGSLVLAEVVLVVFLAGHQVLNGGHLGGSTGLARRLTDARFVLPIQLFSNTAAVIFVYLTARVKYKRTFADAIQWRRPEPGAGFYLLAGLGLSVVSIMIPILFPNSTRHFPIEEMFKNPVSGWLLVVFGTCVAPFAEELFFRGMIYPVIARRGGLEAGVLLSSMLFASVHAPQLAGALPQLGAIFFVGVVLGYARGRTGSLVPGFLMHTSYNATLFLATVIGTKGFREFPT